MKLQYMYLGSAFNLWPLGHFSLFGSGVWKWSVQPCYPILGVGNQEMVNSLKWPRFSKVIGQTTSSALWK